MNNKKYIIGAIASILVAVMLLTGCDDKSFKVGPGEIKHLPFTSTYVIGTDSTIVIVNRESGKVLNVISRH